MGFLHRVSDAFKSEDTKKRERAASIPAICVFDHTKMELMIEEGWRDSGDAAMRASAGWMDMFDVFRRPSCQWVAVFDSMGEL
jgi:hypothetical protein